MSEPLSIERRDEMWGQLRQMLLSGVHPEHGDPFKDVVPVVVYQAHAAHNAAFLARLKAANHKCGGDTIVALGYHGDGHGGMVPGEAFILEREMSDDGWSSDGFVDGYAVNGTSFVFTDDTATWVVLTVGDVQVIACGRALLDAFFDDLPAAVAASEEFRNLFDRAAILPAFQAMASRGRLPYL